MEITANTIYWIGIADNIRMILAVGAAFFGFLAIACVIASADSGNLVGVNLAIICLIITIGFVIAWVFTPDSKTRAAMKVIPAIVSNEQLQGVTKNALELTDEFLRDLLSEQIRKKGKSE